jgi:hypothetical protein
MSAWAMYRRRGGVLFAQIGGEPMTHLLMTAAAGATTLAVAGLPGQQIVVKGLVISAETSSLSIVARCLSNVIAISPWCRAGGTATFQLESALGSIRTVAGEDLAIEVPGADGALCLISYDLE